METILLLLYFKEEAYGRRLLHFLSGKRHPCLHPELITRREKLEQRVTGTAAKAVILTDDTSVYGTGTGNVILLAGEQNSGQQKIFQFQNAEAIYEELLARLGLQKMVQQPVCESEKVSGVILLFSLDGYGITATSVLLSQYLGQQGRCLYFSLSGFPVFYGSEFVKKPDFGSRGLGELLFCSGQENFESLLPSIRQPFGRADLLCPLAHFKDLRDCSMEDWSRLFARLQKEGDYDSIVIEIGQPFETVMELLELGDRVLVFSSDNALGRVREEVFRQYCQMEKREDLLAKVVFHTPPEAVEKWECELPQQSLAEWAENSPAMREMERLLIEGRKEEEDVCVLEEFG